MIFYKYTDVKGNDIILNSRLKVNNPVDFNDPFEFSLRLKKFTPTEIKNLVFKDKSRAKQYFRSGSEKGKIRISWKDFWKGVSDPRQREIRSARAAKQLNEELEKAFDPSDPHIPSSDYFFLCCFCGEGVSPINEILMWSHYAAGHQGMRFSIDLERTAPKFNLTKVKYSEHRVVLDPIGFILKQEAEIQRAYIESMGLKSIAWEYEQEYRWFVDKKFCNFDRDHNMHFTKIDLNMIKRIDFGLKCPEHVVKEVSEKVRALSLAIELKRAIKDGADFRLNYENVAAGTR